jgi:uncharacterized protein (TIGR03437 family)
MILPSFRSVVRTLSACGFAVASLLGQAVPTVTVINYSGYVGLAPIAPGSIASGFGDFGTVTTTSLSSVTPMPKELGGLKLRVDTTDASLYFVSSGQINFVVPPAMTEGRKTVEVLRGTTVVARGTVEVFSVGPSLAASASTAARPGIVQNQDFAVNSQSARAKRGEVIQLYATGCGVTNPASPDGAPPTALSRAVATVKGFISTVPAVVQFAGAHPQFPGICQVNLTVPSQPFVTGQVPVTITVNGVASNVVTVWVE